MDYLLSIATGMAPSPGCRCLLFSLDTCLFQTTGIGLLMILVFFYCFLSYVYQNGRNETADAYMRLYSEDNKRVTEAVYGRKYKLRVGVNNLDSKFFTSF